MNKHHKIWKPDNPINSEMGSKEWGLKQLNSEKVAQGDAFYVLQTYHKSRYKFFNFLNETCINKDFQERKNTPSIQGDMYRL